MFPNMGLQNLDLLGSLLVAQVRNCTERDLVCPVNLNMTRVVIVLRDGGHLKGTAHGNIFKLGLVSLLVSKAGREVLGLALVERRDVPLKRQGLTAGSSGIPNVRNLLKL